MISRIKPLLAPPAFADEEQTRLAGLLNIILLTILTAALAIQLLLLLVDLTQARSPTLSMPVVIALVVSLGLLLLVRRGHVRFASVTLALALIGLTTLAIVTAGGLFSPAAGGYMLAIIAAGLLLSGRAALLCAILALANLLGVSYAEATGLVTIGPSPTPDWITYTALFMVTALLLNLASTSIDHALERARHNEEALAASNRQLQAIRASLELQVAQRTHGLETIAALSERLNAILDFEPLLVELVNRVQERFGYYHVQVYLLDDRAENLVVAEGTGPAGAEMKTQGHRIRLAARTSLVARAARTGEIVRVDNVRETAGWLPNPRLPDTYAEMAVPISLEGRVVGVLDVQADQIAGLDEGDASLLRSLANQVAVTLRNARLFAQSQTALAEARAAQERYLQQAWEKSKLALRTGERQYIQPGAPLLSQPLIAEAKRQALAQPGPALVALDPQEPDLKSIVAPVAIAGQTIGALQLHQAGNAGPAQPWTDQDLALVQAVLDQVAQSAETLRLFQETRQHASREQGIREVTDKLRAATSLDALIRTAAEELGRRFSAEYALVDLGIDHSEAKATPGNEPP
jgi:GAF domain-containing protein